MPTKHDAFISYSHSADSRLAKAIEEGIERLAKPLLKVRAADVLFCATDRLSISPTSCRTDDSW
jgi:hypothetical protein